MSEILALKWLSWPHIALFALKFGNSGYSRGPVAEGDGILSLPNVFLSAPGFEIADVNVTLKYRKCFCSIFKLEVSSAVAVFHCFCYHVLFLCFIVLFYTLCSVASRNFRFGDGYTVTIRLSGERPDSALLQHFMADTFSNSQLREHHQNVLHYQLPTTNVTLAQIFSHMEHARALFNIEDYAVSQTTLDQVHCVYLRIRCSIDCKGKGRYGSFR